MDLNTPPPGGANRGNYGNGSGFDPSKDEELDRLEVGKYTNKKGSACGLFVSVFSYDGGKPKIGLNRYWTDDNGERKPGKLGRLAIEPGEALEVALAIIQLHGYKAPKLEKQGQANTGTSEPTDDDLNALDNDDLIV